MLNIEAQETGMSSDAEIQVQDSEDILIIEDTENGRVIGGPSADSVISDQDSDVIMVLDDTDAVSFGNDMLSVNNNSGRISEEINPHNPDAGIVISGPSAESTELTRDFEETIILDNSGTLARSDKQAASAGQAVYSSEDSLVLDAANSLIYRNDLSPDNAKLNPDPEDIISLDNTGNRILRNGLPSENSKLPYKSEKTILLTNAGAEILTGEKSSNNEGRIYDEILLLDENDNPISGTESDSDPGGSYQNLDRIIMLDEEEDKVWITSSASGIGTADQNSDKKELLKNSHASLFTVDWKLMNICHLDCAYCGYEKEAQNYILDKNRLGVMADRLLELPHQRYQINFKGCESAYHPFLPWIIRRLLASGKDVQISIETTGRQGPGYFQSLCPEYENPPIQIALMAHPGTGDLPALLSLALELKQSGFRLAVKLFNDISHPQETDKYRDAFSRLSKIMPLEIEENAPSHFFPGYGGLNSSGNAKNIFCCQGVNRLIINPDGTFAGSSCGRAVKWAPVWQGNENILRSAAHFIECSGCVLSEQGLIPAFNEKAAAQSCIEYINAKRLVNENSKEYLGDAEQIRVKRRFERIQKPVADLRENKTYIPENPDILTKNLTAITAIFNHCADASSRSIFLHALKALQTGDATWLVRGSQAGEEITEALKSLSDTSSNTFHAADIKAMSTVLKAGSGTQSPVLLKAPLTKESLIDAPYFLLGKNKNAQFRFYRQNGTDHLLEIVRREETPNHPVSWSDDDTYSLSIIIHGDGRLADMRKSVNAILAVQKDKTQIILSGIASKDTAYLLKQEYGNKIQIVSDDEGMENGWLLAAASLVKGKYLTVIRQGQNSGKVNYEADLQIMDQEDAEIGIYPVENINAKHEAGKCLTPADALLCWLDHPAGFSSLQNFIFKKSFLVKLVTGFISPGISGLANFLLQAFYNASKILTLRTLPYERKQLNRYEVLEPAQDLMKDIAAFANFASRIFSDTKEQGSKQRAVELAYASVRNDLFAWVRNMDQEGRLEENLDENVLRDLASCRELLGCLIRDYAHSICAAKGLHPAAEPCETAWRNWMPSINTTEWIPYGEADRHFESNPILSVIIPAHNVENYLRDCLDSVLSQSLSNFEVIIVDDASTDGTFGILKIYADQDKRIRLYRMKHNCRQGVCRNKALEKARGKYVVFVDADDCAEPGFFEKGVKILSESGASLCLFSYQGKTLDGKVTFKRKMEDGLITGQHALDLCLDFQHTMAPWGKMFKTDFVKASGSRFKEFLNHEDIYFICEILKKAAAVSTASLLAYSMRESVDSSTLRPKMYNYFYIHSGCEVYNYLGTRVPSFHQKGVYISPSIIFNLEAMHLPAWEAFFRTTGEFALKDEDYKFLKNNTVFMASLLAGLGRLSESGKLPKLNLPSMSSFPDMILPSVRKTGPVLSVIVPVYKQEELLGWCLDSILEQDFENFEILVIDDASPDNTWKICENYSRMDPRVRIFRNDRNRGQGYSRNFALEKVQGNYIIYVDSDDYLLPGFFSHALRVMRQDDSLDMAHFAAVRGDDGSPLYSLGENPHIISGGSMLERYCKDEKPFYAIWANIFKRSFLVDNGIKFTEHFFEDNVFMTAMLRKLDRLYIDQTPVYVRTVTPHTDSTMNPVKCTPRHARGYLEMCANVSALLNGSDGQAGRPDLALRRIGNLCQGFNDLILDYIASFAQKGFCPLTCDDLNNLRKAPELQDAMLRHFARLYRREQGLKIESSEVPQDRMVQPSSCRIEKGFAQSNAEYDLTLIVSQPDEESINRIEKLISSGNSLFDKVEIILISNANGLNSFQERRKLLGNSKIMLITAVGPEGIGLAKRQAVSSANGKYIQFLEGINPGIEEMIKRFLERESADFDIYTFRNERDGSAHKKISRIDRQGLVSEILEEPWNRKKIRIIKKSFLIDKGIDPGLFNGSGLAVVLQAMAEGGNDADIFIAPSMYAFDYTKDIRPTEDDFFSLLAEAEWIIGYLTAYQKDGENPGEKYIASIFKNRIFQEKVLKPVLYSESLRNINLGHLENIKKLFGYDYFLEKFIMEYALLWQKLHRS